MYARWRSFRFRGGEEIGTGTGTVQVAIVVSGRYLGMYVGVVCVAAAVAAAAEEEEEAECYVRKLRLGNLGKVG